MFSTVVLFALLLGLLVASLVLWALFLYLGLRWAKVEGITVRRVVGVTAAAFGVHLSLGVLAGLLPLTTHSQVIVVSAVQLAGNALVPCLIITYAFRSRFLRSLQAWVPTLVSPIATAVFILVIVRPFLMEAFLIPTNAMAPALVGTHVKGVCPECGRPAYASPPALTRYRSSDPRPQICENFHISRGTSLVDRTFPGDRVIVAKFLRPRRWDLVVFRKPQEPSILHVKRLVGLPGEEIHLDDGAVWANGRRLRPPESTREIRYRSELPNWPREVWGTVDRPAKLAADEYFVLGDFSTQSEDSRFWREGAPDHNPFAVPESHLYGVVTHIYWPPHRWRLFR